MRFRSNMARSSARTRELYGDDPFAQASISRADLRRACETQVKSHLVHLREGFIEARGIPSAVGELVRTAAPAFAALLRNVARLADVHSSDRMDATREGARSAGLPEGLVARGTRPGTAVRHPDGRSGAILSRIPRSSRAAGTRRRHVAHRVTVSSVIQQATTNISDSIPRRRERFASSRSALCLRASLRVRGWPPGDRTGDLPELTQPVNDFAKVIDADSARSDGRADPLTAAGERRRRGRGHSADLRTLWRHPRIRGEDVREPRPRDRPEGARTTACSSCWPSTIARSGSRLATTSSSSSPTGSPAKPAGEYMVPEFRSGAYGAGPARRRVTHHRTHRGTPERDAAGSAGATSTPVPDAVARAAARCWRCSCFSSC